jgi:hypothetical protein
LRSIRDELKGILSKDFWEISDRGGNFDDLEPARKDMLKVFFGWFAEVSGELKTVSMGSSRGSDPKPDRDPHPAREPRSWLNK